jgi:hypothetical protein
MNKKFIAMLIIFGLFITTIPITSAIYYNNVGTTGFNKYNNCYIEISGLISIHDYPRIIGNNMWKILYLRTNGPSNPEAFVFYWYLYLDESAEISIYSEENGDLLWQHDSEGEPVLRILLFSGKYVSATTEEERLQVDINGKIRGICINEL